MYIKFLSITIITYFCCNIVENILHKLSHYKFVPLLYKWHHYHHTIEFPVSKLINNNHTNNSIIYNYYLYIAIIILLLSIIIIKDTKIILLVYTESSIYMYVANLLHESYHKNNTFLEKYKWFRDKKKLHLLHHRQTTHNFNLFDNTSDKIYNTFKNIK